MRWHLINPAKDLLKKIYLFFFKRALYRKIKQANFEAKLTGYRCYVMKVSGWPMVVKKKDLKKHLARRKFKKKTTIQQLEKAALYITP